MPIVGQFSMPIDIHQQTGINIEKIRSHIVGWLQMEYEPKGLDDKQMELFESQIDR